MTGKRMAAILAAVMILVFLGTALGDGPVATLPDGHRLALPEGMQETGTDPTETGLEADWVLEPDLEMLIFSYEAGDATAMSLAEGLTATGRKAEVREIGGTEFLVYQDTDEADGALCVGYACRAGERLIEISFFCGSQRAADLTREIMESYQ